MCLTSMKRSEASVKSNREPWLMVSMKTNFMEPSDGGLCLGGQKLEEALMDAKNDTAILEFFP